MEVESPDDKLALLLPCCWPRWWSKKLCDSLEVVALQKRGYYASYMMANALVEIMQDWKKKRSRHLRKNWPCMALVNTLADLLAEMDMQTLGLSLVEVVA